MKNTGDQGSRGATLVVPNKYSGEAVGLMCVCYGNTQPACHRLNSSCCLQGHRELCWSWDHNSSCEGCGPCVCRNSWQDPTVPLWHVETEATDISPDLITLGVIGGTFNPAALKSVILFLFYSLMWPP